jgi:excinuclease ABC subunit A
MPIESIPQEAMDMILYGGNEKFSVVSKVMGITKDYKIDFEGISNFIKNQYDNSDSASIKRWAKEFMDENDCPDCEGTRLRKESLYFKLNGKNIGELVQMDIAELSEWVCRFR